MFKIYEKERITNHLFSRYGIDKKYFEDYLFIYKHKALFVISNDKEEIIKKIINNRSVLNVGIELFSDSKQFVPCSLGFCIINAKDIKSNYVVLKRKDVVDYLSGKEIAVEKIFDKNILSKGYVVCIYNNDIIGTCYYDETKLIPNLAFINNKAK